MVKRILNWFGRLRFNRNEYVYFYSLPMSGEGKESEEKRKAVINFITINLKGKTIEFTDFFTDYKTGITYFVIGSEKENPFFKPLFFQIYAYTKLKDLSKFSYTYETLIFKEITILKFKIKCYGKKQ